MVKIHPKSTLSSHYYPSFFRAYALRIIRITCLLIIIAGIGNSTNAQPTTLIPIKSEQSGLPESIRRETFATIDRARQSILDLRDDDHLWIRNDGSQTVFPVLALSDPFPGTFAKAIDASLQTATKRLAAKKSQPWTSATASEAAIVTLASDMQATQPIDPNIVTRLSRVKLSTLPPADAALLLIALEHKGITVDGGWQAVINTIRHQQKPAPCHIAIAALGRLKSARQSADQPGDDVLAHVRWLVNRLSLHDSNTTTTDTADPLTPGAACFITMLASLLPRQTLARDPSLFPYTWRNHIANRLIAQQRYDPDTGRHYWKAASGSSDSDLQTSTYAIMTLVLLAE